MVPIEREVERRGVTPGVRVSVRKIDKHFQTKGSSVSTRLKGAARQAFIGCRRAEYIKVDISKVLTFTVWPSKNTHYSQRDKQNAVTTWAWRVVCMLLALLSCSCRARASADPLSISPLDRVCDDHIRISHRR